MIENLISSPYLLYPTRCIIPWLAKTEEPKCPCCRQDFCDAVSTSQLLDVEGNGLVSAGSNARDEIFLPHHFMRTLEGTPLHNNSPFEFPQLQQTNRNNGTNTRRDLGQPRRIEHVFLNGSPFVIHNVGNDNDNVEESNSNDSSGDAPMNNENSNSSSHNEERDDSEEHEEQRGLELTPTLETNTEGAGAENVDTTTERTQQPSSSPPV
mgnify:CR=1 FL=1